MTEKPHYAGHRKRLRERFLKNARDLPDYELLELYLCTALPRRDVKPIAKALLKTFDTLGGVLNADTKALSTVDGISNASAASLKVAAEMAVRLLAEEIHDKPILGNWESLTDYCRVAMGHAKKEQFRILYLNRKNVLIADEVQQEGTIDHTPVYPREVIKRALDLGATALILVHNHPSGDTEPSAADIEMTREVEDAALKLGIQLHDHVIVSKSGHTSFKTLGLL